LFVKSWYYSGTSETDCRFIVGEKQYDL